MHFFLVPNLLAMGMLTTTPRMLSTTPLANAPRWARASSNALFRTSMARMQSTAAATESTPASFEELPTANIFDKYELIKTEEVAERGLVAKLYKHKATGAEVLSVDADDENKVFSCNFRTLPKDDTGVPHILEHSVLCGSRRYPVKEPFVEMLKGSLKTFLNAMTAPDKTMYPVASQNKQDFFNLASVYLDACLFPRILDPVQGPQILKQEGWHYEVADAGEPLKYNLKYKGVVFNEMKGVYSSPDQLHYRALKSALFRGHPIYSIDSGGDPRAIPSLTYEAFSNFHKTYYHPANARLFVYGKEDELPVEQRLALLEQWLGEFGAPDFDADEQIPIQPLVDAPYEVEESYPVDPNGKQAPTQFVTLSWLLNTEPLDPKTKLAFGVLNDLLLGTSSAALQKPLLESQLGASVVGGGYGSSLQQAAFSVGLKGVATGAEAKQQVSDLILSTLSGIAEGGFDDTAIEASMNTVEFRLRASSASPMKGLSFMMGAMSEWNYGRDPIAPLRFEETLSQLKADVASSGGQVFVELLRKYVLDNGHRVTLTLVPEPTLASTLEADEEAELEAVRSQLGASELEQLAEETAALKAAQAAHDDPADLAKLPTLSTADLEPKTKPVPVEVATISVGGGSGSATLLTHELPTDGICYLNVALDMRRLSLADLPYLPLLTRMMSELGTDALDETAFTRKKGAATGGLGISTLTSPKPRQHGAVGGRDEMAAYVVLGGRATAAKAADLFELSAQMLTATNLDNRGRVIEMLKQGISRMEAAVVSSGNSYANGALAAKFTLDGHVDELLGGLPQLGTMREALQQAEEDWPTLLGRLQRMRTVLLSADGAVVDLSADGSSLAAVSALVEPLLAQLPPSSSSAAAGAPAGWQWAGGAEGGLLVPSYEGLQVPTQVNYVAKAAPIYQPGEAVPGSTSVITRYLRTAYLWDAVRVQGGAYGCSLGFSRFDGVASFSSYRDPNVKATLDNYDGTGAFLRSNPLGPAELSKAIIGAVGDLDAPQSVDAKGYTSMVRHMLGVTEEDRQVWRDQVLSTTAADFVNFAERIDTVAQQGSVAAVASERAIAEANEALPEGKRLVPKAAL